MFANDSFVLTTSMMKLHGDMVKLSLDCRHKNLRLLSSYKRIRTCHNSWRMMPENADDPIVFDELLIWSGCVTSMNVFIHCVDPRISIYTNNTKWHVHDDVIKWKHFPRYWPFVRGIHRSQRSVTRSFGVFFDLHPNKRLSKQSRGWWFQMPPCPLWRHCDVNRNKIVWYLSVVGYK